MSHYPTRETESLVEHIHKVYCALTKREMPLRWTSKVPLVWAQWLREGRTELDLRRVIAYRWSGITAGKRNAGCLKWERLIEDFIGFDDDLAECRSIEEMRKKPRPDQGKDSILRGTGREPETAKVKTPDEVLRETQALENLRKWKEENL